MLKLKKLLIIVLMLVANISIVSCQKQNDNEVLKNSYQKEIDRIGQFQSELPPNYEIINFKERALNFDEIIFSQNNNHEYLPLMWNDVTFGGYGIAAYVGDGRQFEDGTQEAVTLISSVLSATLLGIDKSNYNGVNYVDSLNVFFNKTLGVVTNTPNGRTNSLWYAIYPAIIFIETSILYEDEILLRENALTTIESWYQAYLVFNDLKSYRYTGFDFMYNEPIKNDIWEEPDGAVGISMLMYYGYKLTGLEKYKDAAINALNYIDSIYFGSPMYEILLYYGPYLAALYNKEFSTNYDVEKMFNSIFNGNSIPRGGWGMTNGAWNDYNISGLMGSITDGGGYVFSMNTFAAAYIIAKTAKYDNRYASSIGKWLNNLISNSKYYFPDYVSEKNQSMYNSEYQDKAQSFNKIAQNNIPYEGFRKNGNGKSPWFGGDPTVYGWAETDFSLYSGSHMGMLAVLYEETNVKGILKYDLNVGDYFNAEFPTYLIYNPFSEAKEIQYNVSPNTVLFDTITNKVINIDGNKILLEANSSMIIVELEDESLISFAEGQTNYNNKLLAKNHATLNILNLRNNDKVDSSFTLIVDFITNDLSDQLDYYEVIIDNISEKYYDNEINLTVDKGNKTIRINLKTKNGLTDSVTIRLTIK